MWILFCSYPDVMMPAYIRSRWSFIYFAVYIAVVLYFLMSLVRFQSTTMYKLWHRHAPHYCQLILIYFRWSLPIWQVTWLWWWLLLRLLNVSHYNQQHSESSLRTTLTWTIRLHRHLLCMVITIQFSWPVSFNLLTLKTRI